MAEDKLNNFFDTFVNTMSTLQQQNSGIGQMDSPQAAGALKC